MTKKEPTATATIKVSNRTTAAIELYRRAYLLFGDILEFCGTYREEDEKGQMEAEFEDLESIGSNLTKKLQHFIGFSAVLDQEDELENVTSDLLDNIGK